jgi:mannitol-1-/sugar-/sorbitol-6-phosphatase
MPHPDWNLYLFNCDVILLDLDGVLVDSRQCIERHWVEWAARHQLNKDRVLHHAHGRRTVETIKLVAPHLDAEREAEEIERMEANDVRGLVRIPGALELLQSIPVSAWGIATSGSRAIATNRLAFAGLPLPEVLICSEDVSMGKPDPEPYLFAAMMLGAEPQRCVVIEDAPAGIQAGRSGRMHVVGVVTMTYSPDELRQAHAVVRKLSDISVSQVDGSSLGRLIVRVKGI